MGYNTELFEDRDAIDDHFICTICQDVLQDPVYFPSCEHTFCRSCITQSLERNATCPMDRTPQSTRTFRPALRYVKKNLNKLRY